MIKTVQKIFRHIKQVRIAMKIIVEELHRRADNHDNSKWEEDELKYYSAYEQLPEGLVYGSEEYKNALKKLNVGVGTPGFRMHSDRNDHHPEYYECPKGTKTLSQMGLFPLMEMVCDWCGAHIAYGNSGNWDESVEYNISRFDFSETQKWIILETAKFLKNNHPGLK